jgi:hypothetical protein
MKGDGNAEKAKNRAAGPQDAKVDDAIGDLEADADAALAAQAADPDNKTHPADVKVEGHLQDVKDDVAAAAAAQKLDEATDDPAEHEAKKSADGPVYHLRRLHDATCAAFRHDDVVLRHPAVAKGIGHIADPQAFAGMTSAALADPGRASEIPALGAAVQAALSLKAIGPEDLAAAMDEMRKAFGDMYPDVHVKPDEITPGQFQRPYISAGRATQSAAPAQEPRIPLASHVPSADDFQRPLITDGREAASPGSAVKRTYYTNQARDQAKGVLADMHDYIAGQHPDICPMSGTAYEGEDAVPGAMGSSLTTAAPVPERFGPTQDRATPQPVSAATTAGAVTRHVTKAERKAAKRAAKAAGKDAGEMTTTPPAAVQAPAIDRELLKSVLSEIVAEQLGDITKTIGDLPERIAALESAPDPAQQAPRSGAASITKARESAPEVPAGGDGERQAERLVRLVKRAKDPDGGVRTAAIGELMETVGREAAVELLAAI